MKAIFDAPGSERTHGYVIDGDVNWYFVWDGKDVVIRTDGYGQNHPIKTEGVPDRVRRFAHRACVKRRPNMRPEPAPFP